MSEIERQNLNIENPEHLLRALTALQIDVSILRDRIEHLRIAIFVNLMVLAATLLLVWSVVVTK